jgi:hypothetical protein
MNSTIDYIKNPVYVSEDGLRIDCLLKLSAFDEELPFTAYKHDVEPHGVAIYNLIIAGEAGPIGAYVPREIPSNVLKNETASKPVVI